MVVGGRGLTPEGRARYEVISHTADAGIVVRGSTFSEILVNAAYGMFDLVFGIGELVPTVERPIAATGGTREELLVGWLSALLAVAEIESLVFTDFAVEHIGDDEVKGVARGLPTTGLELRGQPVKGVTFHGLAVEESGGGLRARVIFDV